MDKSYTPLLALVAVSAAAGWAIDHATVHGWMHAFMGVALVIFALLKLFSPGKFADGFQMYDLLARPFRPYAYVYPYIELALGLAYLAHWAPFVTYALTIAVFSFGAAGVLLALRRGLKTNCACMGNVLNVPLSTVTLTEDAVMILMAAWMLLNV